jgi:hypothetical protein
MYDAPIIYSLADVNYVKLSQSPVCQNLAYIGFPRSLASSKNVSYGAVGAALIYVTGLPRESSDFAPACERRAC